MKALNTVLSGLSSPDLPATYFFDDRRGLVCSLRGKVVSVINHELTEHDINRCGNGTSLAYSYLKDFISRGITSVTSLPSFLRSEPQDGCLTESAKTKIIIDCIRNEFTEKLSEAAYEILSTRVCDEYQIYHQNDTLKYPSDMLHLSKTDLESFTHERITYWKYNINRLLDINRCDENEVINTVLSCDVSSELNTVSELINSGRLETVNSLRYRGGSLYEIERAKSLMLGQFCFDIKAVNIAASIFGKGLYTSENVQIAKEYCPGSNGGGVVLEITLSNDNKYFEFQDPDSSSFSASGFWFFHTGPAPSLSSLISCRPPSTDTIFSPVINDTPHPSVGSTKHRKYGKYGKNGNISLIRNAEFIKKIKVFDAELQTKIDLNLSPHEIKHHNLIPKRSKNSISSKIIKTLDKRVIDPLTSESCITTVYITVNELPLAVANQRERSTEIKCYIKDQVDQWIRVKPKFLVFCSAALENKPFAISYTKKRGIHQAEAETIDANGSPPGTFQSATPASVLAEPSIKTDCDICLDNCDPDASAVRTSDGQLRHQECHFHALNYQCKPRPEDVIKGEMSWCIETGPHVKHIEQYGSVGQGVITVDFSFNAPAFFDGKHLSQSSQHKSFLHYMPNSVRGRQILKALQTAFNTGKVVTIAHSHTTSTYGLCFNIHVKTSCAYGHPHGYPCDNWQISLIDGLLAAGIDVNLDEENPALTASTLYINP